jgi:hypothetical protein
MPVRPAFFFLLFSTMFFIAEQTLVKFQIRLP